MRLLPAGPSCATVVAIAVALAGPNAIAVETIRPGYWESVNRVISPIQTTTTDRRCIQRKDIDRFLGCYINHHYDCTCPEQSATEGKIVFRGVCVDKQGRKVQVSGHGEYTATTFSMTADFRFRLLGLPISGEASTQAHRIGDACPVSTSPAARQ